MCAADFDDPLSEISSTIIHVRSLSAGNVISDPTKLGSSFMRAPAAREYTPSGCCCLVEEEDLVRSLEDRSRNVTRSVGFGMVGITEKYSVGFAWKLRHGVLYAGMRLPINKLRHFARDSRVLSSHSGAAEDGLLPIQSIESVLLICVQPYNVEVKSSFIGGKKIILWKLYENVRWCTNLNANKLMTYSKESCVGSCFVRIAVFTF